MSDTVSLIRTIRYLGNKRKLASYIEAELDCVVPFDGTVVDLFSGSSSIGYQLLPKYRIISNDIEPYAYCLGKALIEDCSISLSKEDVSTSLRADYQRNLDRLSEAFRETIDAEARFLQNYPLAHVYKEFCLQTPYIANWQSNGLIPSLKPIFASAAQGITQFPYMLFSTYFMNCYFGALQSAQIDSIRYAIDATAGPSTAPRNSSVFYKLIAALVYTASHCVSSPGHFAQASSPNTDTMTSRLLKERAKDIWETFLGYVDFLFAQPRANRRENRAFQMDAFELVDGLNVCAEDRTHTAFYIDPPYTGDHYSRYYHVLNTLLLYDYPACTGKGRYRDDRYASPFSTKSAASSTLRDLLTRLGNLHVPVLVSYTSAGIIPLQDVGTICKGVFPNVKEVTIPYNHSSQGRKAGSPEHPSEDRTEVIFVCQPK